MATNWFRVVICLPHILEAARSCRPPVSITPNFTVSLIMHDLPNPLRHCRSSVTAGRMLHVESLLSSEVSCHEQVTAQSSHRRTLHLCAVTRVWCPHTRTKGNPYHNAAINSNFRVNWFVAPMIDVNSDCTYLFTQHFLMVCYALRKWP